MKKWFLYLYPFLFGIYPVLFLYGRNINEYTESFLFFPLLLTVVFTAIVFGVVQLIIRSLERSSIIVSTIVLTCLSFQVIASFFSEAHIEFGLIAITDEGFAFLVGTVIVIAVSYFSGRYKKHLLAADKSLFFLSIALVVISLFEIGMFEFRSGRIWREKQIENATSTQLLGKVDKDLPDIYYFIFDRYAGPKSLSQEYQFDNRVFFNFLKGKGFYLAEESTANYPKTFLSLGSSLNMEYLDSLTKKTNGGQSSDQSIVTPLIRYSKVLAFLQSKGYSYIHVGPNWSPTATNEHANVLFTMKKKTYPFADEFTTGFLNTTVFSPILTTVFKTPIDVSSDPNNNEHRRWITEEFNFLEKVPQMSGPKFVFAHILLPHDPFVFDENCSPISEEIVNKNDHIVNYLNQMQCANKKVTALIENIFQNSKNPPIIIVQSDEGPFPMKSSISEKEAWIEADDTALQEKFSNLNAYYFPDKNTSLLYPSITPVNSFRVLFNTYFGTDYSLLPDRNFIFKDNQNFYNFIDVTDRVRK